MSRNVATPEISSGHFLRSPKGSLLRHCYFLRRMIFRGPNTTYHSQNVRVLVSADFPTWSHGCGSEFISRLTGSNFGPILTHSHLWNFALCECRCHRQFWCLSEALVPGCILVEGERLASESTASIPRSRTMLC